MKRVLIIYPNWVPSNAVGVLRVRLIVNYLKEFNWQPYILAVHPDYYEEEKSEDLVKLVNLDVRVAFVKARHAGKIRLYGDIALRAFGNLKRKAIEIIKTENIDCIWVPIPPFYTALIGRKVHEKTGVPYVIDYIDPWVHDFPGSHKLFSRAKIASVIANFLEPIAVRKASAFTGVSEAYFLPVIKRNKSLKLKIYKGMPYGFDPGDYMVTPNNEGLIWANEPDVIPYIYAGAFLPNAHYFIQKLFEIIAKFIQENKLDNRIKLYFIGTGNTNLKSIEAYAEEYGIAEVVKEYRQRIPYLEVLHHLKNAAGILAIGSTEKHYTASKIFQALLSQKPVFAVFHSESTVINILKETNADNYLVTYEEHENKMLFKTKLKEEFMAFLNLTKGWKPSLENLEKYSARTSAKALAEVLDAVI